MSELENQICLLLRRRYCCLCGLRPRTYCECVVDLFNLVLEKCEEEAEDEGKKRYSSPIPNHSKAVTRGIPDFRLVEKKSEVIPVKVQPGLKEAVRAVAGDSVSEFCRTAIIEKLDRMREE